jgi:hypothetical protein
MRLLSILLCVVSSAICGFAQVSRVAGSLQGTVADSSSAVIASATVTVKNTDTGQSRSVTSDAQGFFRFAELSVGTYEVQVSKPGFADYIHSDLVIAVGQTVHLAVVLRPSSATANVTVTDLPPVIDTSQTTITTNVDTERIEELPVQSRNYLNFVLLAPGVAPSAQAGQATPSPTITNDSGFSFGGLRGTSNSISIDGLDNNDEYSGSSRTELSLEIVREFQVVNSGLSAEFGGASGGAINVVTKTGANAIHGDAFVFFQNGALSARGPIADDAFPSDLGRYRAGFAIGGPIRKNRTFYYVAFEQEHSRGHETAVNPAAPQINSALRTPALTATPFPVTRAETEVSGKLTHQLSTRNSLMLRYAFTNNRVAGDAFNNSSLYDYSARGSSFVKDHAGVGSLTSVISRSLLNDFRFQLANRQVVNRTTDQVGPGIEIAGVAVFGRPYAGNGSRQENHYEFSDTLSFAHGHHLFKTGGTVNHVSLNAAIADGFGGQFTFASLPEFVAGTPREYRQVFGNPETNFAVTAFGGFLQDTWTIRNGLTLTIGARYDFEHLPAEFRPDTNNFSPRIGLAYSPRLGWIVRAGYGIYYDRYVLAPLNLDLQLDGTQAFEQVLLDSTAQSVWASPTKTLTAPLASLKPSIYQAETNLATPYSQQANLGIERQLGENTTLTASYLFVGGLKLARTVNANLPSPQILTKANSASLGFALPLPQQIGRGVFGPARLNAAYDAVYQSQNHANSTYNGLSVALNRRLAKEITFSGSYTFSKALDDASFFDEQPQDPYALRAERSYSANDQRHRFVFSGLFDLPIGEEEDRKAGAKDNLFTTLFRNIELAPIFSATSGRPVNPLVGFDALHSLAYAPSARPSGDARNSFRTDSAVNLDVRLVKFFPVKPHARLDFVVDLFNAFNHPNVTAVNPVFGPGTVPVGSFLLPIQALRPRQFQFSLDFEF